MPDKSDVRPSLLPDPLSAAKFRDQRRQKFLSLENYRKNQQWADQCLHGQLGLIAEQKSAGELDPFGQRGMFLDLLALAHLRYTAGEPIELVSNAFDEMFSWFCKWHMDFAPYADHLRSRFRTEDPPRATPTSPTPLDFTDIEDFHRAIAVVSLAVLLGKAESLQIAADLFSLERGQDMLLEELLSPAVEPRPTVDFYHVKPYDPLIDAFYTASSPREASAYVQKYLEHWYPSMSGCAWHDGHLVQKDHMTPYNGYWSFEAAAICLIHDIDDSAFRDHIVYPKDLVQWARSTDSIGRIKLGLPDLRDAAAMRLRCQSGDSCPRTGHWFSPAGRHSRQHFTHGEFMPDLGSTWGLTIWQWDAVQ